MTYQSVSEASLRLGASEATIKRWCASGELAATKVGGRWLIRDDAVPAPHAPPTSTTEALDIASAIRHVAKLDLVEEWIPDVLRHRDQLADREGLVAEVEDRLRSNEWDRAVDVAIPKNPFFSRSAQSISLRDKVAYHALVATFANEIERQLPDAVYSARLSEEGSEYFTKKGTSQWNRWRRRVQEALGDDEDRWLIKTDLTAYFDCIRHDFLLQDVSALGVPVKTINSLGSAFERWSVVEGQGLTQGPDVSRILGNLFMLPVDTLMIDRGFQYFRYMDDIRIVARTKSEAVKAMRLFEAESKKRGLIASPAKTELLFGKKAREADSDDARQEAGYLYDSQRYKEARRALRRMFRRSLKEDGHIDVRYSKFALWRLTLLRERGVLPLVMERLEDLAPAASIVGAYLGGVIDRQQVKDGLDAYLSGEDWRDSPYLTAYIFAAMLQKPGRIPAEWANAGRSVAQDLNQPQYLRELAFNVLGKSPNPADLAWLRRQVVAVPSDNDARAMAVAIARGGRLDAALSARIAARSPQLQRTVDYLTARDKLPSLVHSRAWVRIP